MEAMTSTPDLVIRGGTVADGKGGELFEADVAISGGRITEVGKVAAKGKEEIDAKGKLVAPALSTSTPIMTARSPGARTSRPRRRTASPRRSWAIAASALRRAAGRSFQADPVDGRRRGHPEPVLSAGIPWAWESFPDYMEWLSKRNFDMDIGAQLPHAALRVYVMGERGARRDPATPEDNKAMAALAGDAVRSGALGFSTSRTLNHRTSTGDYTPTLKAGEDELTAIAAAMHGVGRSVLQFVLDQSTVHEDLPMMLRVA
jgi:N-acyl-D-aspartate/D-glutamate deacylase